MKQIQLKVTSDEFVLLYNLINRAKRLPVKDLGGKFYRLDLSIELNEMEHDTLMNFDVLGSL